MIRILLVLTAAASLTGASVPGQQQRLPEDELKALFVFNFGKKIYIEWPNGAFQAGRKKFVIGIYGKDPFAEHLKKMAEGKALQGRQVTVKDLDSDADPTQCQILYVAGNQKNALNGLLKKVNGKPVLVVGDSANIARQGAAVKLVKKGVGFKYVVNRGAAKAAGLKLRARFLEGAYEIIN